MQLWHAMVQAMLRTIQTGRGKMGRTILGILAGTVLAWLTITLSQLLSASLYPPPAGMDLRDPAALAGFIAAAPLEAMLCVVLGYGLAA